MDTKKVFARLGVTLSLTEDEFTLLCTGGDSAANMLWGKINRREFALDGETYFPSVTPASDEEWHITEELTFDF